MKQEGLCFKIEGIELLVQIQQEALKQIADVIKLPDGTGLHAGVEGRRPKCYFSLSSQHLKVDCP